MNKESTSAEIRKGLLVVAVLQVIATRKAYAGEILRQLADTEFASQEGTLYPLLSRLKREGYIEYEWTESKSGPPRKYYRLSKEGKARLSNLLTYLDHIVTDLKHLGGKGE